MVSIGSEATDTGGSARTDSSDIRIGILVLGMHRSGTSAVTRVLNLLGAALPKNLHPAGRGNEAGHWEPDRLIGLHDRMLREAGSRWDDWRAFDPAELEPARLDFFRVELARLVEEEYGEAPLFVLKDPRICRFVPLYEEIFAGAGITPRFIQIVRNPLDVAASLGERNEMTVGFAELMWLRHVLEAERAMRGKVRAFVSYDTLFDDWRTEVEHWSFALGIAWPRHLNAVAEEIQAFVSRDHRHHEHTLSDLDAAAGTPAWIREAYTALLSLAAEPSDEEALAKLSHIHAEFDAVAPVLGNAAFEELARREARLMEVHREAEDRAAEARSEIEGMRTAMGERDREITALEEQVASLNQEVAAWNYRVAGLSQEVAARIDHVAALSRELAVANAQLERVYKSRSWRATAPLRLLSQILMRATKGRSSATVSR